MWNFWQLIQKWNKLTRVTLHLYRAPLQHTSRSPVHTHIHSPMAKSGTFTCYSLAYQHFLASCQNSFLLFPHHAGTHRRPLGCSDRAHRGHLRLSTPVLFFVLRANLARKYTGSLFELSVTADYDCVFLFIYSINVSVVSEQRAVTHIYT